MLPPLFTFPTLTADVNSAISVPFLVAQISPRSPISHVAAIGISYHSLTLAFNIYVSFMIWFQISSMRKHLETVSGRLHASLYTSIVTMFIESGSFFTIWITVYLALLARGSFVRYVFLLPYIYTLVRALWINRIVRYFSNKSAQGITRMFIILRMAQDRAWSKDLVMATSRGVLEWQVSSTRSVPLHDASRQDSMTSFTNKAPSQNWTTNQ